MDKISRVRFVTLSTKRILPSWLKSSRRLSLNHTGSIPESVSFSNVREARSYRTIPGYVASARSKKPASFRPSGDQDHPPKNSPSTFQLGRAAGVCFDQGCPVFIKYQPKPRMV